MAFLYPSTLSDKGIQLRNIDVTSLPYDEAARKRVRDAFQGDEYRMCTFNDALFLTPCILAPADGPTFSTTLPFRHFKRLEDMQDMEALSMFLTQPPMKSAQIFWQFRDDITLSVTTMAINNDAGLTWKNILDAFPASQKDPSARINLQHSFVRLGDNWLAVESNEKVMVERLEDAHYHCLSRSGSPSISYLHRGMDA